MPERILVQIPADRDAREILEYGRRAADRVGGELFAVYLVQPQVPVQGPTLIERNLGVAHEMQASTHALIGEDVCRSLFDFVTAQSITQVLVGHPKPQPEQVRFNLLQRLLRASPQVDVGVVPAGRPRQSAETSERVMAVITGDPACEKLIRRAWREADHVGERCCAVYIAAGAELRRLAVAIPESVRKHLELAKSLGMETRVVPDPDFGMALAACVRRERIDHVLLIRPESSRKTGAMLRVYEALLDRVRAFRMTVITKRSPAPDRPYPTLRRLGVAGA